MTTVEERFWKKVKKEESCWYWRGSLKRKGYGSFKDGTKLVQAHRYSYELRFGPIPEGMEIDHLCRIPSCVNPEHLEPVTPEENRRRGIQRLEEYCWRGHKWAESERLKKSGVRYCLFCNRDASREFVALRRENDPGYYFRLKREHLHNIFRGALEESGLSDKEIEEGVERFNELLMHTP